MTRRFVQQWTPRVAGAACAVVFAACAAITVHADPGHARISLQPASAVPGADVGGSGSGFLPSATVQVSFGSATGPVLWTGTPDTSGAIAFSFTVPNAPPGTYWIVAGQSYANGNPVPGNPARASLDVLAAATAPPAPAPSTAPAPTPPAPTDDPAATPTPTPTPLALSLSPATPPPHGNGRPRPPQVASLWRVGGADPSWMTSFAVSSVVVPADTPPVVPLGAGIGIVLGIVAIHLAFRQSAGAGGPRRTPPA